MPNAIPTPTEPPAKNRELAILACTGALCLKKEKGLKAVSPADIVLHTGRVAAEIEQGISLAVQQGWLTPRDERLALTASGIYMAKQALDLPR